MHLVDIDYSQAEIPTLCLFKVTNTAAALLLHNASAKSMNHANFIKSRRNCET
jgi:hypothetical protein